MYTRTDTIQNLSRNRIPKLFAHFRTPDKMFVYLCTGFCPGVTCYWTIF